jgi:hypothetical protein
LPFPELPKKVLGIKIFFGKSTENGYKPMLAGAGARLAGILYEIPKFAPSFLGPGVPLRPG